MTNDLLTFLGLCQRAGGIVYGFALVEEEMAKKKIQIVLISNDVAQRTKRQVEFLCEKHNVKFYQIDATMEQIGNSLLRKAGVLGIVNRSFVAKILEKLNH